MPSSSRVFASFTSCLYSFGDTSTPGGRSANGSRSGGDAKRPKAPQLPKGDGRPGDPTSAEYNAYRGGEPDGAWFVKDVPPRDALRDARAEPDGAGLGDGSLPRGAAGAAGGPSSSSDE